MHPPNLSASMGTNRVVRRLRRIFFFLLIISISFIGYGIYSISNVPTYRIVIDPGHGGLYSKPVTRHGDKYDPLRKKFLQPYREGAKHGSLTERDLMLKLGREVRSILALTNSSAGFEKFKIILRKFSNRKDLPRVKFDMMMTHERNYDKRYLKKHKIAGLDINAPFRHFDFPDIKTGKKQLGRISKINQFAPELVVSLHLTPGPKEGGMAAVITPSYRMFNIARKLVHNPGGRNQYRKEFEDSKWEKWMKFAAGRDRFENFLCDAWIYFTGYWSDKSGLKYDPSRWRGYRQNMVTWAYNDPPGWVQKARQHPKGTTYAKDLKDFSPNSAFFERERQDPEYWRREGGPEGFGGDNHFAANELMRFIQFGLRENVRRKGKPVTVSKIQDPFLSTWELPTYTNAISAFIEVGYINVKHDMRNMTTYRREVAESIAAGIYSLYVGLPVKRSYGTTVTPKGKPLNFSRYRSYKQNYFKMVRP